LCAEPKKFPGALAIVENSYDNMVLQNRGRLAERQASSKKQGVGGMIGSLMALDSVIMTRFHDQPSLEGRATTAFREHWLALKKVSPSDAPKALKALAALYKNLGKKDKSFELGCTKLIDFIDELKKPAGLQSPENSGAPTRPAAQKMPMSRPLALLH
jgi:hypothetical protein